MIDNVRVSPLRYFIRRNKVENIEGKRTRERENLKKKKIKARKKKGVTFGESGNVEIQL